MRIISSFLLQACFILFLWFLDAWFNEPFAANKDVCLLTDMSLDVDDLGALQLALYYHHTNEINLRCVICGTSGSQCHRPIRYMIEWWGYNKDEIRIGGNKNGNGFSFLDDGKWVNSFNSRYNTTPFNPENGATLLNQMIAQYPDMIVIEVGPATTVRNANAKGKIKTYYQMGGNLPSGGEFNLQRFPSGAVYIANTGQVNWLDNNVGRSFQSATSGVFPHYTPVAHGYAVYPGNGRPSWDPFTVLWAITGNTYFNKQKGNMTVFNTGSNSWSSGSGVDYVAVTKNARTAGNFLNSILKLRPQDVESRRGNNIVPIIMLLLLDD